MNNQLPSLKSELKVSVKWEHNQYIPLSKTDSELEITTVSHEWSKEKVWLSFGILPKNSVVEPTGFGMYFTERELSDFISALTVSYNLLKKPPTHVQ